MERGQRLGKTVSEPDLNSGEMAAATRTGESESSEEDWDHGTEYV